MTFSSRGNPKIAASPVALTSLGAVGGARGTAAGALRIFVEFLTTYDRAAITELEGDLRNVDHAQNNSNIAEEKRQRRLTQVKNTLAEAERVVRGKLNTELRSDLKRIEELETSRSKRNRTQAATERAIFNQTAKSLGVSKAELEILTQRAALRREESTLTQRQSVADQGQLNRAKQRQQIETAIGKVQATRAALAPRLAGLAIGAVGGIVGGAVLGLGFQLAEQGIAKIGDVLQDIIDPARHARDAIDAVGSAVLKLAQEQKLTLFEAATQKAEELGLTADKNTPRLLAQFAAQVKVNESVKAYLEYLEAVKHPEAQRDKDIQDLTKAMIARAYAEGNVQLVTVQMGQKTYQTANQTYYLAEATKQYDALLAENTATIDANAQARLRLAEATAFARIQQEALSNALQAQAALQTAPIDAKIEALGDVGPSARTQSLQAALDRESGGGRNNTELKNIAEERGLILLRQRLRLLGTSINLEKYSGKFLLEAINAKTAALDKEAAEQDRLNKLLDLQYRMSKQIRRQQGEGINDFIERRAQEQRAQLAEGRDLERQAQMQKLNDLKDRVQDEVALAELSERKLQALRSQGLSNHVKNLQKQLEASQKADKRALKDKQKALEAEKAAIQKKTQEAIELSNTQSIEETLAAIRGAKNIENLSTLSGRIAGLQRAKGTIQGLVDGFAIPAFIAKPFLDNINKALGAYQSKENKFFGTTPTFQGRGGPRPFAKGGVIMLNNSRSPFGSNVKSGEEGTELGVILSNRVANILKNQSGGPQQVGPFYLDRSDNWMKDKYELAKVVEQAVDRAIRR